MGDPRELDQFLGRQASEEQKPSSDFDDLENALEHILQFADELHLDPYPTHFEVVPPHIMHEIAAYGLPDRYAHWTHGKAYRQMKTMHDYGLSRLYEVVINGNPSQAFLLENNFPVENKLVMAHVLGHTDFFKNNYRFKDTREDMVHASSGSAERMRQYERKEGKKPVEEFLDAALTIAWHIDPYVSERLPKNEQIKKWKEEFETERDKQPMRQEFDDVLEIGVQKDEAIRESLTVVPIPLKPDRDVLGFIRDFAPYLEDWQRDILDVVRGESLYFWPQMRTKIMNEGWASFSHVQIMRRMGDEGLISGAEAEHWFSMHGGVVARNARTLNPYFFGLRMYEYIVDYHNGDLSDEEKRWLEGERRPVYPKYEGPFTESPGLMAAREVMMHNDDESFIRNYFDKNVADRMNVYIYGPEANHWEGGQDLVVKEKDWEVIRDRLAGSMANAGIPIITVQNGETELYLRHEYEGTELDNSYVQKTLPFIYKLWGRAVHLDTYVDGKQTTFVCSKGGTVKKSTVE